MKYGIREICDVVLKAKSKQKIGNKVFYKDEPVCYFDSLKTSSLEGAATTVYAQGGRGNSRLVAWEGERTVTFTMEDALISTEGLALLTGAGIIEPTTTKKQITNYIDASIDIENKGFVFSLNEYSMEDLARLKAQLEVEILDKQSNTIQWLTMEEEESPLFNFDKSEEGIVTFQLSSPDAWVLEEYDGRQGWFQPPSESNSLTSFWFFGMRFKIIETIISANTIPVHTTEITDKIELRESNYYDRPNELYIDTKYPISDNTNATIYINILQDGIIQGEPYIGTKVDKNRIQICEKQIQPPVIQQEQIEIIGHNDGRNGIFIPMDLTTYEILCEQNVEAKGYNEAHELVESIPISEMSLVYYDYETPGGGPDTSGLLFNDVKYEWAEYGTVEISYIGLVEKQPAKYYTPDLAAFCTNKYLDNLKPGLTVLLDYYTDKESGVQQIEITPDKFGGNYYLEASTLFRDTNGVDMPAEFIIPNCKIQSNFTFSMASSGDPSTFTFTMDAFPDYTRFDRTKKVLSVIQVITDSDDDKNKVRKSTDDSLSRI